MKRWLVQAITDPPSRFAQGPPTISGEKMQAALDHLSATGWNVVSVFAFMAGHGPVILAAAYREEEDDVIAEGQARLEAVEDESQRAPRMFTVDDYGGRDGEGGVVRARIERLVPDGWAAGYLDDIKAGMVFRFSAPNRKAEVYKAMKDAVLGDPKLGVWMCEVTKHTDPVEG